MSFDSLYEECGSGRADCPPDEESELIEAFFGPDLDDIWTKAEFPPYGDRTGSDEETEAMIQYALNHAENPDFRGILESWLTNGF